MRPLGRRQRNRKAECEPIRGRRCDGLVALEAKARIDLAAAIAGYDTKLNEARSRHDAEVTKAETALAALPALAAADDFVPLWAVLGVVVFALSIAPGILLWWGSTLLARR